MSRWWGIRHLRWYWHSFVFWWWWESAGKHLWLLPNHADIAFLDAIWEGDA